MELLNIIINWVYMLAQASIAFLFSPQPPPAQRRNNGPRIAVIGAGITGVSSAAHCLGHGFEVTIFEAGGRDNLGGIWSRVNNTSSLQIHSIMYRFHPSVKFRARYPSRQRIVEEVTNLWHRYHLEYRTRFDFCVENVWKDECTGKWYINEKSNGPFDGVIAAVGTCGDPKVPHIPKQEDFSGEIYHSSQLTGKDMQGRQVLVVGGGASAVEAIEYAVKKKAKAAKILARSEKWIIPRNPIIDGLLALNIFGEETSFAWIPETLLKKFFYRDLEDLAPANVGLYSETPMVNDDILDQVRTGQVEMLRGDIRRFAQEGIIFNHRHKGVPKGGPGREILVKGDICIMATGFHRPSLHFLPDDVFTPPYQPPNFYLQAFPVGHTDICANNCTFVQAIGTVGNVHVGVYTRYLLMFIADPDTRPSNAWMRAWVDTTRVIKGTLPAQGLDYFTYSELVWWFVWGMLFTPTRWKWIPFVLFGWGNAVSPEKEYGSAVSNGTVKH